ncbi:MAG TPA: DUF5013 domain-containing protein [Flavisolibacter sp.]|nr:DUF5013 domain-containing protein [Flavisolibacter sp.]
MKLTSIKFLFFFFALTGLVTISCSKDDSKKEYGYSKIFMPQAIINSGGVDNNYNVPSGTDSSTYNYYVDTKTNKISIILGAALAGPSTDAYSVDIQVNNDTIQKMFTNKVLDTALYKLLPASMFSIPAKLDVAQGARTGTFTLDVDIAQLKSSSYTGKYLVLAVKLANPTKYEVNNATSTTIVIINVNALVIGPAVNITAQYIKNPGGPFIASGFMSGSTRWGNLKDWSTNAAARSHGGFGGFNSDNGGTMDMESGWGSPQILNGKIYQTITLPAGTYSFDLSGGNWTGGENFMKDIGYGVIAPNLDTLPDYNNIANNPAVYYQTFAKPTQPVINFQLTTQTKITLGTVVNYVQDQQGFKTKQVLLYSYPKHL